MTAACHVSAIGPKILRAAKGCFKKSAIATTATKAARAIREIMDAKRQTPKIDMSGVAQGNGSGELPKCCSGPSGARRERH